MPDLKITGKGAIKALDEAHERAETQLRHTAEGLAEELQMAADVLKNPLQVDITAAAAAFVIDFSQNHDIDRGQVSLQLPGGHGNYTEIRSPLAAGRYRAIILINRLPAALDTSR